MRTLLGIDALHHHHYLSQRPRFSRATSRLDVEHRSCPVSPLSIAKLQYSCPSPTQHQLNSPAPRRHSPKRQRLPPLVNRASRRTTAGPLRTTELTTLLRQPMDLDQTPAPQSIRTAQRSHPAHGQQTPEDPARSDAHVSGFNTFPAQLYTLPTP